MADEYIRKQDAVDAVAFGITIASAFNRETGARIDLFANENEELQKAIERIKGLSPADVVPVVRCRDCKFRENDDFCTGRGFPCQLVPDDGFCDKGERKVI